MQFDLKAFADLMTPLLGNPALVTQLAALLLLAFTIKLAIKAADAAALISFAALGVAGLAFVAAVLLL